MSRGGSRFGSGRACRNVKAEITLSLDIRVLKRDGLLQRRHPFTLSWHTNYGEFAGSATLLITDELIQLSYRYEGFDIVNTFQLEKVACNFGGSRFWLKCPQCESRSLRLFFNKKNFKYACRSCVGIAYSSQSEGRVDRVWRKQLKQEKKLGENWAKPKGMHHNTYSKIMHKILECEGFREDLIFNYSNHLATLERLE